MTDIKRGAHGGHSYTHRAIAAIAQAAPVQNTWYTVLAPTEDVRIIAINIVIATAIEDLEVRLTIDGVVITGAQAAAAVGTTYKAVLSTFVAAVTLGIITTTDTTFLGLRPFMLEGRRVQVEVRKTTAAGVGILSASVVYASRS